MSTPNDIIIEAMRQCGAVAIDEAPSASEINSGLFSLNAMLGSWSAQSTLVRGNIFETFPITSNTYAYTIGVGATFNTSKPFEILSANVQDGDVNYQMDVIDMQTYYGLMDREFSVDRPCYLAYDPTPAQQVNNRGTIYLYYIPDKAYTLTIESHKPLTSFSTLYEDITLEPHYMRALVFNLALELFYKYHGIETHVPALLMKNAEDSLGVLRQNNSSKHLCRVDIVSSRSTRQYDYRIGY